MCKVPDEPIERQMMVLVAVALAIIAALLTLFYQL